MWSGFYIENLQATAMQHFLFVQISFGLWSNSNYNYTRKKDSAQVDILETIKAEQRHYTAN